MVRLVSMRSRPGLGLYSDLGKERARWSGQVLETIDYCGFIGRSPGSNKSSSLRATRARHDARRLGRLLSAT